VRNTDADYAEGLAKGIISGGLHPKDFMIGIHNAFSHGEIFEQADLSCDFGENDIRLTELMESLSKCCDLIKEMEAH
jgi:hypothetical protein